MTTELSDLPSELILQIVQNLDIDTIGKLGTMSSQYSGVCNDQKTWKFIFKKELADDPTITVTDYKQAIIEICKIKSIKGRYIAAAEKGYLKLLVRLDSQQNKEMRESALRRSTEMGHLEIVKYLLNTAEGIENGLIHTHVVKRGILEKKALENGRFKVARYLYQLSIK